MLLVVARRKRAACRRSVAAIATIAAALTPWAAVALAVSSTLTWLARWYAIAWTVCVAGLVVPAARLLRVAFAVNRTLTAMVLAVAPFLAL
ncbi:MAG: hypothetical protein ABIR55_15385 [Burkholderiaceae bacterium]